jgi:flagellin-specific chaperone FliS
MKTNTVKVWLAACAFYLVIACAQLGLAPAKSFESRLAYAYATHTAVLEAAASAVKAGTLSKTDGQAFLKISDEARTLLDSALNVYQQHDTAGADNKLALATAILTELQSYLNKHLGT